MMDLSNRRIRLMTKKHLDKQAKMKKDELKPASSFSIDDSHALGMAITEATKGVAFFTVKPPKT